MRNQSAFLPPLDGEGGPRSGSGGVAAPKSDDWRRVSTPSVRFSDSFPIEGKQEVLS
jgi:hypothetical protein